MTADEPELKTLGSPQPAGAIVAIRPDWPAPPQVKAAFTTRHGGVSSPPYDSLNLGLGSGDNEQDVHRNRQLLRKHLALPSEPRWLRQVHGRVVTEQSAQPTVRPQSADASVTSHTGVVLAVLTADCVPVLLCDRQGTCVGAAHAGWRGLANGVLTAVCDRLPAKNGNLIAALGPAIGPSAYEVGAEVRDAFAGIDASLGTYFYSSLDEHDRPKPGKHLADLYGIARRLLEIEGIRETHGGEHCTFSDARNFFSYRRDGPSGRMASLVWLDGGDRP